MALEWLAVVGTLGGAVVGAATTLAIDTTRARREKSQRFGDTKREIYVKYLTTLVQTDTAMQALGLHEPTPLDREAVTAAFRSFSLVAVGYELDLVAARAVREDAAEAYRKLRDIREALIETSMTVGRRPAGSPEWHAVHEPFLRALDRLRQTMRHELNAHDGDWVSDPEPLRG
ncbi:hypothetical protein ACQP06_22615 [Nocardia sp. CA-136227]|uniref:hypothetical protein n=1 Tax=Nocardia sp. CA-136227 TaxID=3239979 RepID=UPI003D98A23E